MNDVLTNYKKATTLIEVDNAVRFDVPISSEHEFFTDFSEVRGDFEDRMVYKSLNVNPKTFEYNREANIGNKTILFLAGMRGSGKTSELSRISDKLDNMKGFFCVTCNLDVGLDVNDMEYMDILIFQLERLFEELDKNQINIDTSVIESLQKWFSERINEINKIIKKEGGLEVGIEAKTPSLFNFLGILAKVKANILGTKENADKIRTVFKNNFTEFAQKVNEFFEHVNIELRKNNISKELLFIVDGLEKVATKALRKKIVDDESNRIRQIRANTIFTLPLHLMPLRQKLIAFSTVVTFPFVKIREKKGDVVPQAVDRFMEFVFKRIDESLFDSPETVKKAILYGGGSPRELLRILEYWNLFADEEKGILDEASLDKAIKKLAAETAQYVSNDNLEKLKILKENNEKGIPTPFDEDWQDLLEKLIVLEYNDGNYKRVNPIVEVSELYKHYVE